LSKNEIVTLSSVSVFPRGNQLFLKVAFVGDRGFWLGDVKGTIIFGAVPRLDTLKQTLSFENIDFTADTKSTFKGAAFESAAWVLNPVLINLLQKFLVVDFSPQLKAAVSEAKRLSSQIKLPAPLNLSIEPEEPKIEGIAVYGDRIYMNFDASGTTKVTF